MGTGTSNVKRLGGAMIWWCNVTKDRKSFDKLMIIIMILLLVSKIRPVFHFISPLGINIDKISQFILLASSSELCSSYFQEGSNY